LDGCRGYIYYSVVETATHYFIHYADFHARDYKGGEHKGVMYSDLLRIGARVLSKGSEPSGKLAEAAIAHENDMEGTLVVVEKSSGLIAFVETLHHNRFSTYSPEDPKLSLSGGSAGLPFKGGVTAGVDGRFKTLGSHVELYVEPKGHGIQAWGTEPDKQELGFLLYKYAGRADDPESAADGEVSYDLLPIGPTLWQKAKTASAKDSTFAGFKDYGTITIDLVSGPRNIALGTMPSAFNGNIGGANMARPLWGWYSVDRREDPPGLWFFDPAKVVKRDYNLPDSFSTAYLNAPFWALN